MADREDYKDLTDRIGDLALKATADALEMAYRMKGNKPGKDPKKPKTSKKNKCGQCACSPCRCGPFVSPDPCGPTIGDYILDLSRLHMMYGRAWADLNYCYMRCMPQPPMNAACCPPQDCEEEDDNEQEPTSNPSTSRGGIPDADITTTWATGIFRMHSPRFEQVEGRFVQKVLLENPTKEHQVYSLETTGLRHNDAGEVLSAKAVMLSHQEIMLAPGERKVVDVSFEIPEKVQLPDGSLWVHLKDPSKPRVNIPLPLKLSDYPEKAS